MTAWIAAFYLGFAPARAQEPAAAEPAVVVSTPAAPAPATSACSLAEPLRELLAQLTPYERSRFFERHPGLKKAIGWRERPPSPRVVDAGKAAEDPAMKAEEAREKREADYHIRWVEPPPDPEEK
jgi:hypothetical protein